MTFSRRRRSQIEARGFDLGCEITEIGSELELVWLFQPDILAMSSIAELKGMFLAMLTNVCRSPESRAAALTV
jgi:hypothetical protein